MGLFSKELPCPICGGKISWFLPQKIEGQYVCDKCYFKIDMDKNKASPCRSIGNTENLKNRYIH